MARRRLTLTTRGAVALGIAPLSALAGVLLGAEELVLLAIGLGALFFWGLLQSASRARRSRGNWRVSVKLAASDAEIDGALAMVVTLAAAGRGGATPVWLEEPGPCWARARRAAQDEPLRPGFPNPALVLRVPHLASGDTVQLQFAAPTGARGVFVLRGLRLWCFDSFGFLARLAASGPSATITVHPVPAIVELDEAVLQGEQGTEDNQPRAVSAHPRRDNFGDFSGLRPYIPGDRLRLLYWPALVRSGELMVRDFEDSGPHRVHVVADVRPLIGEHGCERVLAAVAGVGLLVLAGGSVLELSTTAGERLAIGPGPLADIALLRAIANMETIPSGPTGRWRPRRRHPAPPEPGERDFHALAGTPLVVTTADGAAAMPGSLGFAHLVVAS